MRTGILHPIRVRKRLCVSVLGVKCQFTFQKFESIWAFVGVFVKQIIIFNIGFGSVVLISIW